MSGSGISWGIQVCTSLQADNHHSSFLQARCPSCCPTNSVKALKEQSIISPLRKKPTLDKEELSDCWTISNLSLISKIMEHVVKSRLMDHLTSNSLLNSHQSAYCKHHSIETALLYIHDHLISAIGSQKVSCLC